MIQQKVLKLKKETTFPSGVKLPAGQEIEVVMDVVYMGGFPLPPQMQANLLNWIVSNPDSFTDETLNWKKG